jgi:hypothetical protein
MCEEVFVTVLRYCPRSLEELRSTIKNEKFSGCPPSGSRIDSQTS